MRNVSITILLIAALILGGYLLLSRENGNQVEDELGDVFSNQIPNNSVQIKTEGVNYYDNAIGYLARPEGDGPFPGLILVHEWWGMTDDIKDVADRFARAGYVALAVDLYNGSTTEDASQARILSTEVRENMEEAFNNLGTAVTYLKSQSYVDPEKTASVGWCFGGGWAYEMAVNDLGTRASVMYYGQFDPEDDFEMMKSSILGHFGEDDTSIMVNNVREFQASLESASTTHEVYIYPNVGHGFANKRGGSNTAYSESAAELAWIRTQEFLEKVLEN